jgi:hypothetical protein
LIFEGVRAASDYDGYSKLQNINDFSALKNNSQSKSENIEDSD